MLSEVELVALIFPFVFGIIVVLFFSFGWLVAKFKRRNKIHWGLAVMFGGCIPLVALIFLPRLPENDGDENVAEVRSRY